jgi:hypothetical protein
MASLFQGAPQTATSYTTSSTETPKWMQDAIFNQIYLAQNIAAMPYEAYKGELVAGASPLQQKAYQGVEQAQGTWKPGVQTAQAGTSALANAPGAMAAAQPYLTEAGQTSVGNIGAYMNPYTQNVTDQIAKLGARNLSENLLPAVSDAFIRSGSFGGTRMGEFGERALRDTQESVLAQQNQALQSGYGQALGASQADLARQAGLASTAGGLTQTDLTRQQGALQQMANLAQQGQQLSYADTAALQAAGQEQQALQQKRDEAAYQQFQLQQQYPRTTADWLSTQVRGMAPIAPTTATTSGATTGATYSASPLSQIASGLSAGAGLYNLTK